jgi:UDP-2,3-diacylglucosamine pyrophosphatase LpxH
MLRPLWRGAKRLVINGDVAELHDPHCRARAARMVLDLQALCAADGVELVLLSGNHDPMLTDHRLLVLAEGEILVTHGDVLHPAISPWNSYAPTLQAANEEALARLPEAERAHLRSRLAAVQHTSHWNWDQDAQQPHPHKSRLSRLLSLPAKAARTIRYWSTLHRRAMRFLEEEAPQARFFIFGHYHRSGVWRKNDRVVINTGAFVFPARPLAVLVSDEAVRVRAVVRQGGQYELSPRPGRSFALSPAVV